MLLVVDMVFRKMSVLVRSMDLCIAEDLRQNVDSSDIEE